MSNQYGEGCIVLLGEATDRSKSFNINKRLLIIHILLALFIYILFIGIVIEDPEYVNEYGTSKLTFIVGMGVWLTGALFFASVLMWIPAGLYAKTIRPEIFLYNEWLIYLSGSKSLDYQGIAGFYPFFKYLLGYDSSQRIRSDEIISINIESARLLSPGFSSDTQLIIKHKYGEIRIGRWMGLNEQKRIMDRLEKWRQLKSS